MLATAAAKSLQSCLTLGDPIDGSPPGSSVHGILYARTLQWVAMPSSRGSSQLRDQTHISYVSCIGRHIENYTQYPVVNHNRKEYKKECVYMCVCVCV